MRLLAPTLALAVAASATSAQVGYDPARSPYTDLERSHELTYFSGFYRAHLDPARVAPRSGPMVGLRYQWRAGGPVNLMAEFSRVESERRVLDPDLSGNCTGGPPEDCKLIGMYRWPLYFMDFGMAFNVTGARAYRRLVPEGRAGLGFVTDFHTRSDVGDFAFGTKIAMSLGAGVRWIPKGRYQVRLEFADRIYTVKYPVSYYAAAPDSSAILIQPNRPPVLSGIATCCGATSKESRWMNNAAFTIGISYLFGR
jgi:hypothetical protein